MSKELAFVAPVSSDTVWSTFVNSAIRVRSLIDRDQIVTDDKIRRIASSCSENDAIMTSMILETAQKAERRCAFSSGETLRLLCDGLIDLAKFSASERAQRARALSDAMKIEARDLMSRARRPSESEFSVILRSFIVDPGDRKILLKAIELAGIDGKISIETARSSSEHVVVEKKRGFNFRFESPITIPWVRRDVRVLLIEGVVEFVHEIHHAFEKAASEKFPLLIIARGFSGEVVKTAVVNRARGSFDVFLAITPQDVESVNLLADVSACVMQDPVNPLKGETISSRDMSEFTPVDSVSFERGLLTIQNARSKNVVAVHRNNLVMKSSEAEPGLKSIYDGRIKSLSSGHVTLTFPLRNETYHVQTRAQRVGAALKLFRALHEAGVTDDGTDSSLRRVIALTFAASQLKLIANVSSALLLDR